MGSLTGGPLIAPGSVAAELAFRDLRETRRSAPWQTTPRDPRLAGCERESLEVGLDEYRSFAPPGRELRNLMLERLSTFERREITSPKLVRAAVAIAVTTHADEASFLLTQRAGGLSRHAGQFALPGGRLDPGESVEQAVLRELGEEVGLELDPGSILGCLDDFETRSGFCITPLVVWGGADPKLHAAPGEVEVIHRVPLTELARDPLVQLDRIPESDRPVLSMQLLGMRIFAPTAALIYQWREVALNGRATRVHHYEQPTFAWR